MPAVQSLTLPLTPELAARLAAAAARTGLPAEDLVLRALADHLDDITAYGQLGAEMAFIKDRLAELAAIVGDALAEPTPAAMAEICRYRAKASSA